MDPIPNLGEYQVRIRRKNREVELTLSIQSRPWNLMDGKNRKQKIKGLHVVVAKEIAAVDNKGRDCFDEKEAACWILLTSLEVNSLEDTLFEYFSQTTRTRRSRYLFYRTRNEGFKK